jgi:galactokinase
MIDAFRQVYGGADGVRVYRAPGRVNLIGEHTDYNLGFVMPVALDLATWIATAPAAGDKLRIRSEELQETVEWPVREIAALRPRRHWTDYVVGVAQQLIGAGHAIAPANLLIRSTVPEGAGLSSSAALEVSAALALLDGRPVEQLELAKLCQRAEREFVGMPCGIMDQYISVFGREGRAIRIDCRSLESHPAALPAGVVFLATNTMVKHALAGSAYKQRTEECATAARLMGKASLRDVSPAEFERLGPQLPEPEVRRARHVVTEDDRVERFAAASEAGDLPLMGRLLVDSHRSLQHDYEVSCDELDFLVDAALAIDGVIGSRMTGGGFGGCTVTMLLPESEERFRKDVARAYREKFGVEPAIYPCRPSAGAGPVQDLETIPAA